MKLAVLVSLLVIIPFQVASGSCVGKNVDVWVANGHDLTGDGLQNPDPYVVVRIGSQTEQTQVIHDEDDPTWWEKLQFQAVTSDMMIIDIWEADEDLFGHRNDDHLGTCMVPMVSGGQEYHAVRCNANDSGYVKLFYKCK